MDVQTVSSTYAADLIRAEYGSGGYIVYDRSDEWEKEHSGCRDHHDRRVVLCTIGDCLQRVERTTCAPSRSVLVMPCGEYHLYISE